MDRMYKIKIIQPNSTTIFTEMKRVKIELYNEKECKYSS